MRRWFLSYHSPDQALAGRLKTTIERKDSSSRVFFAPEHMRAGRLWSRQLADEIAQADAFILLIGEKGIGPWQELEYDEALDRWATTRNKASEFPLVVVLLEGQRAPGLQFLRRMHWIVTRDPESEREVGRIFDAAAGQGSDPGELWRCTSPYRGLEAMEEKDSDYFFGRTRETVEVLKALAAPDRLPLLIGNSGVGKSSLAKAGVLAALKRQAWPETAAENEWPDVFKDSRQWCFISLKPGTDPLKALVECFLDTWQFAATDLERVKQQLGWIELLQGKASLSDLIDATQRRRKELDQPQPPAFLLYIDQGEELYVRAEESQRRRFSELIAQALPDPRLRMMMSLRSDFLGSLQSDKPLFRARQQIDVPPLGEEELREVVSRPAQLLGARFETERLIDIITQRTAEDAVKDVGALPLLSYTLDDMWTQMVHRGDSTLRLPAQSFELGGVLVERVNKFLAERPGAEDALRRVLTLRLATVREDGEPTRRRALRSEFSEEEWRLVSDLADHPNRLLVTVTPQSGETYAEVAHEAIFRRWDKLREWIAAEREFLAWRSGLEAARRAWQATPDTQTEALLMGAALTQAQSWSAKRREDLSVVDRDFIDRSTKRESKARARARRVHALIYVLLVGIILGLVGVVEEAYVKEEWNWVWTMRPYRVANFDPHVLTPEAERALKPGAAFRECTKDCPEMIVVPAGNFMMGSPGNEKGRYNNEDDGNGRQIRVTISQPFAVSKSDVTFADWDACVSVGGCPQEGRAADAGWGRGTRPVIYVSWDDAQAYAAWLSRMTGKTYRLLTEAEWEYAARAGSPTAYYWGDEIGKGNANCAGCSSQWDNRQTSPVGSFKPNAFGLYDMAGNVWQWVQDCYHPNYDGAPPDGSAWTSGDCSSGRVLRGGSWDNTPQNLRSAVRGRFTTVDRGSDLGFRVGRTLIF
jgi:formylglycine-generating enzyme required for sulfatase activity